MIAGVVALWPAAALHRANAFVQVGTYTGAPPRVVPINASESTRPADVTAMINAVRTNPYVRIDIAATSRSPSVAVKEVRDSVALARATAAAVAPTNIGVSAGVAYAAAHVNITVSPVEEQTIRESRPAGRLAIAAVLLIGAIAWADALFLTRTRWQPPHAEETTRARRQRRKRQRAQRRADRDRHHAMRARRVALQNEPL